ncbi:hypothetical protein AB4562_14210, partial [Vibrio sp. 10N.222.54.A1]
ELRNKATPTVKKSLEVKEKKHGQAAISVSLIHGQWFFLMTKFMECQEIKRMNHCSRLTVVKEIISTPSKLSILWR